MFVEQNKARETTHNRRNPNRQKCSPVLSRVNYGHSPRSRMRATLPLCGAYPFVGYCGSFLNKLPLPKKSTPCTIPLVITRAQPLALRRSRGREIIRGVIVHRRRSTHTGHSSHRREVCVCESVCLSVRTRVDYACQG